MEHYVSLRLYVDDHLKTERSGLRCLKDVRELQKARERRNGLSAGERATKKEKVVEGENRGTIKGEGELPLNG